MDDLFVKIKILFDRGKYWVSYLTFFMLIFVTVTSMKEYAIFSFLSTWYWLFIMLLGSMAVMLILGYVELKHTKAFQKEIEIYAKLNPVQKKMFDNQDKIIEMVSELKKEVDELKTKK